MRELIEARLRHRWPLYLGVLLTSWAVGFAALFLEIPMAYKAPEQIALLMGCVTLVGLWGTQSVLVGVYRAEQREVLHGALPVTRRDLEAARVWELPVHLVLLLTPAVLVAVIGRQLVGGALDLPLFWLLMGSGVLWLLLTQLQLLAEATSHLVGHPKLVGFVIGLAFAVLGLGVGKTAASLRKGPDGSATLLEAWVGSPLFTSFGLVAAFVIAWVTLRVMAARRTLLTGCG
ncbi:MAG: hypothetical protein AAF725_17335 [Acidobacteriota bacterium]